MATLPLWQPNHPVSLPSSPQVKSFGLQSDLRGHEKQCGVKRWHCSCGNSFSRKDKLANHLNTFTDHSPLYNLQPVAIPIQPKQKLQQRKQLAVQTKQLQEQTKQLEAQTNKLEEQTKQLEAPQSGSLMNIEVMRQALASHLVRSASYASERNHTWGQNAEERNALENNGSQGSEARSGYVSLLLQEALGSDLESPLQREGFEWGHQSHPSQLAQHTQQTWQMQQGQQTQHPSTCLSSPSTCLSSPSTCLSTPSTCLSSPSTCLSSTSTCLSSPSTCLSSPSTCLSSPSKCLSSPFTCLSSPYIRLSSPPSAPSYPSPSCPLGYPSQ
ncbi:unnamed protein product [Closterium sp. NIES-65]|nr:unnamed protein product [Closterium sp. NIES-65]